MRAALAELLADAAARGGAVGAFTAYNLETALGILAAAEDRGAGVILLVSPASVRARGGPALVAALAAAAERARVPSLVQLDHAGDLDLMRTALEAGAGAVMADGSALPDADNAALVRSAVELAASYSAGVEAELGRIEGNEDVANAVAAGALTDPEQAAPFVAVTGAACLAVSIGNVHGAYRASPDLDWERLATLRRRVAVPLSLHGASGIPDGDLRRAFGLGIAKFNVNTELRERYLEVTAARLPDVLPGLRLLDLNLAQADAVAEVVAAKLDLCAGRGPPLGSC
jgi:tagatose 1,6-diphosphate aldolase GatY/KbaY